MIYLQLFLTFLKIGAFSFGGGYGMISLMTEEVLKFGWLTYEEVLNFIGVETVIPGPIAVNMATYIGYSQGGVLGSLVSTLGVILPSFIIILIISKILKDLLKYKSTKAVLSSIVPAVTALISATAVSMMLKTIFDLRAVESTFNIDVKGLGIFVTVFIIHIVYKKLLKKEISPVMLIAASGVMGALMY